MHTIKVNGSRCLPKLLKFLAFLISCSKLNILTTYLLFLLLYTFLFNVKSVKNVTFDISGSPMLRMNLFWPTVEKLKSKMLHDDLIYLPFEGRYLYKFSYIQNTIQYKYCWSIVSEIEYKGVHRQAHILVLFGCQQ